MTQEPDMTDTAQDIAGAGERLTRIVCGSVGPTIVSSEDLRALLCRERELVEALEVAAVHLQLAGGWLREAGDDGQRANTLLTASNKARAAATHHKENTNG